ncbi:MAG TPA: hypothetical protein VFE47_25170 [Tepidisphaeraceae bacterium]|nr:hypothetical protein [Tepidisphaeraceae bacterium]
MAYTSDNGERLALFCGEFNSLARAMRTRFSMRKTANNSTILSSPLSVAHAENESQNNDSEQNQRSPGTASFDSVTSDAD